MRTAAGRKNVGGRTGRARLILSAVAAALFSAVNFKTLYRHKIRLSVVFTVFFFILPSYAESSKALKEEREDAFFTQSGDIMQIVIPLAAAGYSLAIWDVDGLKSYCYSFGTTMIVTYTLKYAVGRPRPYQDPDGRGHSFPSGHTAAAFSGASYLQRRYGWYVGGPAYAMAAAVGYSRVWSRNHYWTDVLAGAAIATIPSYIFTKPYEKPQKNIQISGGENENGRYLTLSVEF